MAERRLFINTRWTRVHLEDCPHFKGGRPWNWAVGKSADELLAYVGGENFYLRWCQHCRPDLAIRHR